MFYTSPKDCYKWVSTRFSHLFMSLGSQFVHYSCSWASTFY